MIDWSKMSAREVWEALKTAPKVSGPWTYEDGVWKRHLMPVNNKVCVYDEDRASTDDGFRAAGWLLCEDAPASEGEKA